MKARRKTQGKSQEGRLTMNSKFKVKLGPNKDRKGQYGLEHMATIWSHVVEME